MKKEKLIFLLAAQILMPFVFSSTVGQTMDITKASIADSSIVYKSDYLIIRRLSNHVYQHISYLKTNDFGKVDCNGMIVINQNEAIVFDTPADDEGSVELINFLLQTHYVKITGLVPTHFHADCVAGLEKFCDNNIPCYASNRTIALLKLNGKIFSKPMNGFEDSLIMIIGDKKVYVKYFGEGHTKDNIVGYFPEDQVVFGGCLVKTLQAGKGNLEDANVKNWSETVRKLKIHYPQTKIVIPGHGKSGGVELFDYTIKLFE